MLLLACLCSLVLDVVRLDVHDSLPAVLFLAYKYADPDQARKALLANTNVGGNTVHRGAILGAILGAAHGAESGFGGGDIVKDTLLDGLHEKRVIASEIEDFLANVLPTGGDQVRAPGTEASARDSGNDDSKTEL